MTGFPQSIGNLQHKQSGHFVVCKYKIIKHIHDNNHNLKQIKYPLSKLGNRDNINSLQSLPTPATVPHFREGNFYDMQIF